MKSTFSLFLFSLAVSLVTVKGRAQDVDFVVEPLKGFPNSEKGIEQGVSACFAGVIDDCLVMAGGCNFPETPAVEGGKKRYYRGIYLARLDDGRKLKWKRVGNLPEPTAYGVSVLAKDCIVCVGGNNGETSLSSVYKIKMKNGKAIVEQLPALPVALDNFTGALQGDSLVVFGDHMLYSLNLADVQQGWKFRTKTSVQRLQPVSGFVGGDFYVWGGYKQKTGNAEASLSFDGMCFHNDRTMELDGPCHPAHQEKLSLCGAAAVNLNAEMVVAMGGVDNDIFLNALNSPAPDYLTHPSEWYRFSPWIFSYGRKGWQTIGQSRHVARAGATLVAHKGILYLIGGELKPGIRVPSVCRIIIT